MNTAVNTDWKRLSVAEFVSRCNWENISVASTTRKNAQNYQLLAHWQRLTCRELFALQNWSGRAFPADGSIGSDAAEVVFDLTNQSSRFWQCFNWSGEQKQPAPQQVESILEETKVAIAEVEEFTLNDLSQLF